MCGITGIINPKIKEKEGAIREMTSRIFHRGPDEDGFFVDENVALGMRRLSIIDLSTGKQPVTSADGKLLIIFNGEIYNYKELRGELIKKGCIFKTNSDTEVILHMYEIFGDKMLLRLRGMFAFCIYNTEKKNVFLARDYFGIKPLYYYKYKESIVAFSSEIKSFFALKEFTPIVNDDAVYNYLSFQYNPLEETFFKSVYKLQPGHFMNIDIKNGITEIIKYWSYEIKQNNNLNELGTKNKKRFF